MVWLLRKDDRKSLRLAAVKEASGKEDDGDHEGEAGVHHVAHAKAEEGVCQPCGEAYEPDPRCLSHHRSCSGEELLPGEQPPFDDLVLHY